MGHVGAPEFEQWYEGEHPRLLTSLTVAAGDLHLAAEVTDEAFARAYERWTRVSSMESPAGWTYITALNVLRRRARRRSIEQRLHLRSRRNDDRPPDWSVEVWDALGQLPVRERTAMALRYVADMTTDQIADAMGIASGTVGSTLSAARRNLACALGDDSEVKDVSLEEVHDG
jgi:RNA polymerase sigma factor (sigma-70 family)